MKIAMLGIEFPPKILVGVAVHSYYLTKNLASNNVTIDLYLPNGGHCQGVNIINVKDISISSYSNPDISGNTLFSFIDSYNSALIKNVKNNFDIIHCHDWITSSAGIEIKNRTKKPMVLTIHSTEFDRSPINPWEYILKKEKIAIDNADEIIAVSSKTKNTLIDRFNANENKINVIHNAIDHKSFYTGKKDKKIVLFLGRLVNQKGPEFFLDIAKKVLDYEDAKFIVVGDGYMLPELINKAIDMGIENNVTFTGFISDEEAKRIYSISDVYVMPSISEPFGITALEAMASKACVILSKTSGVSEIVNHAMTCDFWDIDQMANKIIAILRYPCLKNCMNNNGLQEIKSISWDNVAKKTIDIYNKVLQ